MVLSRVPSVPAGDGPLALLRARRADADAVLPRTLAFASFLFLTTAVLALWLPVALHGGWITRTGGDGPQWVPPGPVEHNPGVWTGVSIQPVADATITQPAVIVPVDAAQAPSADIPVAAPTAPGAGSPGLPGEAGPAGGGGTGGPATADPLPAPHEFVYYEVPPEPVAKVLPDYPDLARQAGMEGTVQLLVLVGRDGQVADVRVERSAPMFDAAAVSAARQWRFRPALASGHPVAVWIALPVRFTLH